jgi:hypothetical protein
MGLLCRQPWETIYEYYKHARVSEMNEYAAWWSFIGIVTTSMCANHDNTQCHHSASIAISETKSTPIEIASTGNNTENVDSLVTGSQIWNGLCYQKFHGKETHCSHDCYLHHLYHWQYPANSCHDFSVGCNKEWVWISGMDTIIIR